MAEIDLVPQDQFRQLARRYNELRTNKTLPQIEVNRPGPDIAGFYRRLEANTRFNEAATGVTKALAESERARRAQQEAEYLQSQWGSIDLSGVSPQFIQQQGLNNGQAIQAGGVKPYGRPYQGNYGITSGYKGGYRSGGGHSGTDFGVPRGTPIYATHDGVVGTNSGGPYGNQVTISGGPYMTRYAHLDRFAIKPGTRVKRGQLIGYSGNTGSVSGRGGGYHLHYEVWVNGQMTNPYGYL